MLSDAKRGLCGSVEGGAPPPQTLSIYGRRAMVGACIGHRHLGGWVRSGQIPIYGRPQSRRFLRKVTHLPYLPSKCRVNPFELGTLISRLNQKPSLPVTIRRLDHKQSQAHELTSNIQAFARLR